MSYVLLMMSLRWVPDDAAVLLGMDDTLCRKTGRHIWGAGMHHDPLRSTSARPFFACFFTTDVSATPIDVVETYAKRWPLEVAFRDIKQELGLEDAQSWTRRAVERAAPMAMVVYGLTVLWYAWCGHAVRERWFVLPAWHRRKSTVSFADMLATLRQASWAGRVLTDPAMVAGSCETSRTQVIHAVTSLSTGA